MQQLTNISSNGSEANVICESVYVYVYVSVYVSVYVHTYDIIWIAVRVVLICSSFNRRKSIYRQFSHLVNAEHFRHYMLSNTIMK